MSQYVTLEFKRGTASNWSTTNPTLAPGEPGFELDTGKMKIGTGATGWNNLPYMSAKTNPLTNSVSLGVDTTGQGNNSVAIGVLAGKVSQGTNSVAIGGGAGDSQQGNGAVAIGSNCAASRQGNYGIAIGDGAGNYRQGTNSVAIGQNAGGNTQADNTIILNASGSVVNGVPAQTNSFYVRPIRQDVTKTVPLMYDPSTFEIVQGPTGNMFSVPLNSILWTPDGTSVTGTTGLQYASGVGITMDVLNIQSLSDRVSIGRGSGNTNQSVQATAIGFSAGNTGQGIQATAVGAGAGSNGQKDYSVAIGAVSGSSNQGIHATAVGAGAGTVDQGDNAVAVGRSAGTNTQGANSVAIGAFAGHANQAANTIILNASGVALNGVPAQVNSFYVKPIRTDLTQTTPLCYNSTSGEIVIGSRTTTGSWTVPTGASTQSITVPLNGTYSIWVRGIIENGIIVYTATVVVTNDNVPAIGSSYAWYYTGGGSPIVLTSIPTTQIVGVANTIVTTSPVLTTANVFNFGITNNSATSQTVNWGYTTL